MILKLLRGSLITHHKGELSQYRTSARRREGIDKWSPLEEPS